MSFSRASGFVTLLAATSAGFLMVDALSFPLISRPRSLVPHMLTKRDGSTSNGGITLDDKEDLIYSANITLGGAQFEVSVDTGSTDLWIAGDVPETRDLHIPLNQSFGIGTISGSINTADLIFDDFVIPSQAYLNVVRTSETPNAVGFIGLGPSTFSSIRQQLNDPAGDPVLDRIFRQNLTTPNVITLLLPRVLHGGTETDFHVGQLTVGSVITDLDAVVNAPKLPVLVDEFGVQHWQSLLDADGIIGPDGKTIETKTAIQNPLEGTLDQLRVMFDSGFSLPQVPKYISDAIYSDVPNATFIANSDGSGTWQIPCEHEMSISFIFAGVRFPIAPLDMSFVNTTTPDGRPVTCGGSFQATSPTFTSSGRFGAIDAILGTSFLRNAYLLINLGDFVDGSSSRVAPPFIQLLPTTTNLTQAHTDFVVGRLSGVASNSPTTSTPLTPQFSTMLPISSTAPQTSTMPTISSTTPTGINDKNVSGTTRTSMTVPVWAVCLFVVMAAMVS